MCGIYGSTNFYTFNKLNSINRERGNFACGTLVHNPINGIEVLKSDNIDLSPQYRIYNYFYLGHLQSPTSSKRDFSEDTTHPFKYKDCYLAHNGVINNFEGLKRENPDLECNEVDSSIILPLIYRYGFSEGLSKIEGTFACWMFDMTTCDILLFRSGSTLFINNIGDFSSKFIDNYGHGFREMKEGIVYRYDYSLQRFIYMPNTEFKTQSGFFI